MAVYGILDMVALYEMHQVYYDCMQYAMVET